MGKGSNDLLGIEARIEGNLDLQINLDIRLLVRYQVWVQGKGQNVPVLLRA